MVLVQKWPLWQLVFFTQYRVGKCLLLSMTFKSPEIDIFPNGLTHGFGPKMASFAAFLFLGNIGQENVFYDTLERKNAFLGYKNKKFKNTKNWHFPKGLTHGFGPKMTILATFFFRQYRPGKCLSRYSRTKKRLCRL